MVDLKGQLTDGAMVEVTLNGTTDQETRSRDISEVEYLSPGSPNAPPNSPCLKSHTGEAHRVRSVSADCSNDARAQASPTML